MAQSQRDFDRSLTRAEATRTVSFWQLAIAFSLFVAANIALLFHGIAFVSGSGFTVEQAGFAFGFTGVSGLISKETWGWALGRASLRYLSIAAFALAASGTSLLLIANATQSMLVLLVGFMLWGFGFGGVTPLSEYMWATYFGRRYLGAVRSAAVPTQVVATALGPLLVAMAHDSAGSYRGAFVGMVIVYVLGALIVAGRKGPSLGSPPAAGMTEPSPARA